jgi:hypothetical protein
MTPTSLILINDYVDRPVADAIGSAVISITGDRRWLRHHVHPLEVDG